MEEEQKRDETLVAVVKEEEIESLPELGFEDDGDLMVYKTNNGIIGVDKETGMGVIFLREVPKWNLGNDNAKEE